jgi:hypothetical protein
MNSVFMVHCSISQSKEQVALDSAVWIGSSFVNMSTINVDEDGNVSGEGVPDDVLNLLRDPQVQACIKRFIQEDRAAAEDDEDDEGEEDDLEDEDPAPTGTPASDPVPTPPPVPTPNYRKRANKTGSFIQQVFYAFVFIAFSVWIGSVISANCSHEDMTKAFFSPICGCIFHIIQYVCWESSKKLRLKSSKWTRSDYRWSNVNAILYCICAVMTFSEIWWSFSALNRDHQDSPCRRVLLNCPFDYVITWWVLLIAGFMQPIHSFAASDFVFFKGK